MRRIFVSLLMALGMILVIQGPAFAASYDVYSASGYGGAGRVNGTLDFVSATKFNYDTTVQDICPGDGLGVEFNFDVRKVAAGSVSLLTEPKGGDYNNCGNGFNQFGGSVYLAQGGGIKDVAVVLCFTNNGQCVFSTGDGRSSYKDNPYT